MTSSCSPLLYSARGGGPNCKLRIDAYSVWANDVAHTSRDCGRGTPPKDRGSSMPLPQRLKQLVSDERHGLVASADVVRESVVFCSFIGNLRYSSPPLLNQLATTDISRALRRSSHKDSLREARLRPCTLPVQALAETYFGATLGSSCQPPT